MADKGVPTLQQRDEDRWSVRCGMEEGSYKPIQCFISAHFFWFRQNKAGPIRCAPWQRKSTLGPRSELQGVHTHNYFPAPDHPSRQAHGQCPDAQRMEPKSLSFASSILAQLHFFPLPLCSTLPNLGNGHFPNVRSFDATRFPLCIRSSAENALPHVSSWQSHSSSLNATTSGKPSRDCLVSCSSIY